MRRFTIVIVAVALGATACSGDASTETDEPDRASAEAAEDPEPEPEPEPDPEPDPDPEPEPEIDVVDGPLVADATGMDWDAIFDGGGGDAVSGLIEEFVGSGDDVVSLTEPWPAAIVRAQHRGSRNFIVRGIHEDGSDRGVVNTVGAYTGERAVAEGGDLTGLSVQADGEWAIQVMSPIAVADTEVSRSYEGVGDSVVVFPFGDPAEPTSMFSQVTASHDGERNFIVRELFGRGVINDIGPYEGTNRLASDLFGIEVTADGAWTLALE